MKLDYFNQDAADADDLELQKAILRRDVPKTCLLGGLVVAVIVLNQRVPCDNCAGPRHKCKGTPRLTIEDENRSEEHARLYNLLKGDDNDERST